MSDIEQINFYWRWNDAQPQPDRLMTRQRAALLLRAWRRSARQPANYTNVTKCKRVARGVYYVVSSHGETGTMYVLSGAQKMGRRP